MQLLNYRYDNRFVIELPKEGAVDLRLPVMKLLFQPIVENAVYHGLDESRSKMTIRIMHRLEGGDHLFVITDDGVGMSFEDLQRIRMRLSGEKAETKGSGIGFRNIHERLRLRYGASYGIRIASEPSKGTEVTVRIPVQDKGGGKDVEGSRR